MFQKLQVKPRSTTSNKFKTLALPMLTYVVEYWCGTHVDLAWQIKEYKKKKLQIKPKSVYTTLIRV